MPVILPPVPAPNPDLELLRLLLREQRLDVATLQSLRNVPQLDQALIQRGLLSPQELAQYRAALTPGAAPGLGQVGDYRLVERIGQGGMGQVFVGEHVHTGVRRAVKVATALRGDALVRFQREGEAQALVDSHPNVLKVYGGGASGNKRYLIMDLATGGDLNQRLERGGPFDPHAAAHLVAQLADGLHHVHGQSILHRDIKPANVLFDTAGVPMLVDFGLARLVDAETLTRTHALLGTPAYMAPEQVRGLKADARTDVYGLGTVLYECLTGSYLFENRGEGMQVLAQVLEEPPVSPRSVRKEIPAWLESVCLKALAKDPADRFATAAEFAEALRAQRRVSGPRSMLPVVVFGLIAILLGGGAGLVLAPRDGSEQGSTLTGVAQLATEVHAALHAPGPLADEAPRVDALRARFAQLDEPQGAEAELEHLRTERDLLLLQGLVALASDDEAQARTCARTLRGREERLRRKALDHRASPLATALSAYLAVDREPQAALLALGNARRVLDRPELRAWSDVARMHTCLAHLEANDYIDARAVVTGLEDRTGIPSALEERALELCRREVEITIRRLEALPPNAKSDHSKTGYLFRDLLRFLRAFSPKRGLTDAQFASLMRYCTEPMRRVITVGPELADLRPDEFGVQRQVADHWLVVDGLVKIDRKALARMYRPAAERAYQLADPSAAGELGSKLTDILHVLEHYETCRALCSELLARDDLSQILRARILSNRGDALRNLKRYDAALRDLDASLELQDEPLTRYRRAHALWFKGRQHHPEIAEQSAQVVADLDLSDGSLRHEEREAFRLAVVLAWRAAISKRKKGAKDYAAALATVDALLSAYSGAEYAGWHIRRAYLRIRVRPAQLAGAIEDLETARALVLKNPKLADLHERVGDVLKAVRTRRLKAQTTLWKLCAELTRRRQLGGLLP